jgi:hypothetical protein
MQREREERACHVAHERGEGFSMPEAPEFKLKANIEISTKGNTKHILAVTGLLLVLLATALTFAFLIYHSP